MPDELADLDANGSPVKSRIGTPNHAIAIVNRLIRDDMIRAGRRVKVQGMVDGNAPHSPTAQRQASRAGDANLNYREAKGHILNAWTPYNDLVTEVPVCIDGDLEYADPDTDAQLMRGFAEYFHDMVFGWRGFDRVEQLRDWQMLVHGIGTNAWEDSFDWRPKTILQGNVYVPDETESDLDNAEEVMLTTSMNAGELWQKIENEAQATAIGWNVKAVKNCIMHSARADSFMLAWKWDRWQQAFKNGDIYISQTQTKRIRLATIYVKEMDGKISQHIVQYGSKTDETAFLFSSIGRFEDWEQCVCPFAYDVGSDGTWHSVKGLGTEIYAFCELSNRIKNTLADLIVTSIKPMFQPATGTTAEKFQLLKLGGYNILPPNINAVQMNIGTSIAPALEVSKEMQNTLMQNTGTYRQNVSGGVERTAKEVSINAMDQAKLSKGSHNRFYRGKDRQYAEMWRRATNPNLRPYHPGAKQALIFQQRCYKLCDKLNIKHDALQKVGNIRATRSIGLGSAAMRMEIANALMNPMVFDRLDPVGQNHVLRAYIANLLSFASVDSIVPSLTTGEIPTEDNSIAVLENNALDTGGQVVITPRQNHVIHLDEHVGSMEADAQAFQQGADATTTFNKLEYKGAHAHEHLVALTNNPMRQQEAKAFGERLRVLANLQDQLQQNIEEQQQANPPPTGQPDPAMAKVQGTLQLKSQKQQADLVLKQQHMRDQLVLKQQQQNTEIALKAHAVGADTRIKDLSAAATIKRQSVNGNS